MTSTIPACKDCKHFQPDPDKMFSFSTCAIYYYEERVDYLNGEVRIHNSLALSMRYSEDHCGRDGKDFEANLEKTNEI
jgi:hypothetical protein